MNTIPLQPVCIGRIQADLPRLGARSWAQSFDLSEVERMASVRTRDEFWSRVHARKNELESSPHDIEPNRMSRFLKVGEDAAIILYREHEGSKRAHRMQRYLWLGEAGYGFQTGAMREHLTRDLTRFERVFNTLRPLDDGRLPQQRGFCIDGALVHGEVGRISAGVSVNVPGWNNVRIWAGATEGAADGEAARRQAAPADTELDREREAMATVQREDPGASGDPVYPRQFDVLRQRERPLEGIPGREVVWRKELNNGAVTYTFRWKSEGDVNGAPTATLGLDAGERHKPTDPLPDEQALVALWDAMLNSVRRRPGAY